MLFCIKNYDLFFSLCCANLIIYCSIFFKFFLQAFFSSTINSQVSTSTFTLPYIRVRDTSLHTRTLDLFPSFPSFSFPFLVIVIFVLSFLFLRLYFVFFLCYLLFFIFLHFLLAPLLFLFLLCFLISFSPFPRSSFRRPPFSPLSLSWPSFFLSSLCLSFFLFCPLFFPPFPPFFLLFSQIRFRPVLHSNKNYIRIAMSTFNIIYQITKRVCVYNKKNKKK